MDLFTQKDYALSVKHIYLLYKEHTMSPECIIEYIYQKFHISKTQIAINMDINTIGISLPPTTNSNVLS
jgi:NurA-like 5'-3' nuclease